MRIQGTGGEDDDSPVGASGIPEEKRGSRRNGTHLILAIGETEYKFALLGFSIGLKATPEVRRVRKEAFDAAVVAVAELPVEVSKEVVLEAFRDLAASVSVTARQTGEWLETPEGNQWQFRRSLQAVNPQMTNNQCNAVFDELTPRQWKDFSEFQAEPFRDAVDEDVRLRADLRRIMETLNPAMTNENCDAVFEWMRRGGGS